MKNVKKVYMLLVFAGMIYASAYAAPNIKEIAGFVQKTIVPIVGGIAILTGGGMIMLGEDDTAAKGKKVLIRAIIGAVVIFAFAELLALIS